VENAVILRDVGVMSEEVRGGDQHGDFYIESVRVKIEWQKYASENIIAAHSPHHHVPLSENRHSSTQVRTREVITLLHERCSTLI
jgi:hypothetical protein